MMKVGIDGISFAVPRLVLPISGEWAERRAEVFAEGDQQKLVAKVTQGIGIAEMAVPDTHEDIVTLGAGAVRRLLENQRVDLSEISHLLFATEGGVDFSKSCSAYVLGLLSEYFSKDASHIASVELKFACAASSYALEYAHSLIRSGLNGGKKIIVVASDIARYDLNTPGEYTQGAGAVAMLVSQDPSLVVFEPDPMASAGADEHDFFRPLFRDTPTVDGKHSVEVYLNLVEQAFGRYLAGPSVQAAKISARDLLAQTGALLFHVPFPKMAEYMASRILLPHFEEVSKMRPEQLADAEKNFRKSSIFQGIFAEKVAPSLLLARSVGNIYSGSLPLALASALCAPNAASLAGSQVLFFAYGSGATARVFGGKFTESLGTEISALSLQIPSRTAISFADYERLHAHAGFRFERNGQALVQPLGPSVLKPRDEFVFGGMKANPPNALGARLYHYQA